MCSCKIIIINAHNILGGKLKEELYVDESIVVCYTILVTAVAQWLRCCATNRKVAGSIPTGVIGIFN